MKTIIEMTITVELEDLSGEELSEANDSENSGTADKDCAGASDCDAYEIAEVLAGPLGCDEEIWAGSGIFAKIKGHTVQDAKWLPVASDKGDRGSCLACSQSNKHPFSHHCKACVDTNGESGWKPKISPKCEHEWADKLPNDPWAFCKKCGESAR